MKFRSSVSGLIVIVLFQAGVSLTTNRSLASSERRNYFPPPETLRFRLDSSKSKFIAHALPGGLLWFKGHEHLVGVREFSGEAQLTTESINPASLQITAKTESMVETSDKFTDAQKQIINKELREIV